MSACCAGAAGAVPIPCGRLIKPSALRVHHSGACLAAQQVPLHAHFMISPVSHLYRHGTLSVRHTLARQSICHALPGVSAKMNSTNCSKILTMSA